MKSSDINKAGLKSLRILSNCLKANDRTWHQMADQLRYYLILVLMAFVILRYVEGICRNRGLVDKIGYGGFRGRWDGGPNFYRSRATTTKKEEEANVLQHGPTWPKHGWERQRKRRALLHSANPIWLRGRISGDFCFSKAWVTSSFSGLFSFSPPFLWILSLLFR